MPGILSSYQLQSWDYVSNPFILSAAKLRLCPKSFHPISCKVEIMSGILSSYQLQSWDYVRNPFIQSAAKLSLCQESFILSACKVGIMPRILSSFQHAKLRLCQESFPSISCKVRLCQESFHPISKSFKESVLLINFCLKIVKLWAQLKIYDTLRNLNM